RPARVDLVPSEIKKFLTPDQYKLYNLIWERFVASQMSPALLDTVRVDLDCGGYTFRTGGYNVVFQGYMALYEESSEEDEDDGSDNIKNIRLPMISEGDTVACTAASADGHLTEPPARYTEASLIKALEDKGIGRPSTITPTITTITARRYVSREGKSLVPTKLGEVTTDLMRRDFADIVDYQFTANMESMLDAIENGTGSMDKLLSDFWRDFSEELERASADELPDKKKYYDETDIICDKCGAKMVVRTNRSGVRFAACPNYPVCRNTRSIDENGSLSVKREPVYADFKCELCGGPMVERTGPYGKFFACANYPECRFVKNEVKAVSAPCPKCGGKVLIRSGKRRSVFYSCENYPDCDFSSWDEPTAERCPECGGVLFIKRGKTPYVVCRSDGCKYRRPLADEGAASDGEDGAK
ncbi:MAG: topoisomerase DNA-binding C4 zinc finger domain-containing protein, partial [Clostridia bacterium]|nr:topoisomerase DNA-binding C4 zinc finger domain-containing protein [Clostridia bacterium]